MRESNRNLDIPPGIWILTFNFGQVKFPTYICDSCSNTRRIGKNWSSNTPPHVRSFSFRNSLQSFKAVFL